ncbi:hypothetical protein BLNAU_5941 [Blattamonas nauphoetae]|uniref:Uncharacterized protein n=1 Tax=Blattamonas nauphoetae TaxID=2049346 RepID=A0ABQ9Y5X9_9EUKA|nr:hypothetical protein BLNAU_5941 [Blattamonas nauphoetae]
MLSSQTIVPSVPSNKRCHHPLHKSPCPLLPSHRPLVSSHPRKLKQRFDLFWVYIQHIHTDASPLPPRGGDGRIWCFDNGWRVWGISSFQSNHIETGKFKIDSLALSFCPFDQSSALPPSHRPRLGQTLLPPSHTTRVHLRSLPIPLHFV